VKLDPGRVRFVLVEPQSGGNVGAAARAMKNLGFSRMALVSPACDPRGAEAGRMAVEARDVLASAVVFEALDDALRGAACVVGTSRRTGRQRRPHHRLDEFSSEMLGLARLGELAIVFGREDHGLCDLDLDLCTHLVHLPGSDDYPSFNLAQAVLLCAYELRRAALEPLREDLPDPPAAHDEREAFYRHLKQALLTIGYVHGDSVVPIMRRLRRLLGRAMVTTEDVRMLRGLARQILWTAEQAGLPLADDEP
jgi:tRNA/rRNA methyltransferase